MTTLFGQPLPAAKRSPSLTDNAFDVPNLDAMDEESLRELGVTFARLSAYAGHRANAMSMRTQGDVEAALASEKAAESQYRKMPSWAQW
jgi:hypothetical protein